MPKMVTVRVSAMTAIIGAPVYHNAMRNFGGIMLLLGILGFFYASQQVEEHEPAPPGTSVSEELDRPAGRWEVARYVCAGVAGIGLLLALFPKGR